MSLQDGILFFVMIFVAGLVAQVVAAYSRQGWLGTMRLAFVRDKLVRSLVIGVMGALLGQWLTGILSLPTFGAIVTVGGTPFSLLWTFVGAILFAVLLDFLSRRGWLSKW